MSFIYSPAQLLASLTILGWNIFTQNFERLLYYLFSNSWSCFREAYTLLIPNTLNVTWFSFFWNPLSIPGVRQFHKDMLWFGTSFPSFFSVSLFNLEAHFLRYVFVIVFFFFFFIISSSLFVLSYLNGTPVGGILDFLYWFPYFLVSSFPLPMLTFPLLLSRSNIFNL